MIFHHTRVLHAPRRRSGPRAPAPLRTAVIAGIATIGLTFAVATAAHAEALPVPEGSATPFAILAGSTIDNSNISTVTGDIGLDPGTAVVGYADGADTINHTGALEVDNAVALDAKNSMTAAYTQAAAQATDFTRPTPELGGLVLTPGVYDSLPGTFANSGTLTLDAEGDPDAIFIFQMDTTLITSPGSTMLLLDGASSCNVYWVVGSSATLGTNSTAVGTVMADQSIGLDSGATLRGRAWASVGAVTLDNNVINTTCVLAAVDDDDTTGGDDTTGDDDTTAPTQVPNAPTGGVATGDGSTLGSSQSTWLTQSTWLMTSMLAVAAIAGAVTLIRLARRPSVRHAYRTSGR
jgi:hypothetical protein